MFYSKFKLPPNIDRLLIPIIGKKKWLQLECSKPEYQSPCKLYQQFECVQDQYGTNRIRKCHRNVHNIHRSRKNWRSSKCICPPNNGSLFIRDYENEVVKPWSNEFKTRVKKFEGKHWLNDSIIGHRVKRSHEITLAALLSMFQDEPSSPTTLDDAFNGFDVNAVYQLKKLVDLAKEPSHRYGFMGNNNNNYYNNNKAFRIKSSDISNITTSQLVSIINNENFSDLSNYTDYLNRTFCTVTRSNLSIECNEEIYSNQELWKEKKEYIDSAIRDLQQHLLELKGIRRYINGKRPRTGTAPMPSSASSVGRSFREPDCHCENSKNGGLVKSVHHRHNNHNYHHHPLRRLDRQQINNKKKWNKRQKKQKRKEKFENTNCKMAANEQMHCFTHDNHHWKTPPLWIGKW